MGRVDCQLETRIMSWRLPRNRWLADIRRSRCRRRDFKWPDWGTGTLKVGERLSILSVEALHLHFERDLVFSFHYFRKRDKLVNKFLSNDFLDDILVVIVTESTAELIIVHIGFIFTKSP